ncbi:MAG: signal peptidase II [Clostridia bacterium]|nr:signal peptidase II [Clostridia bacterium]MBR0026201.1 signal peptidase II [Clostridia bacterium]
MLETIIIVLALVLDQITKILSVNILPTLPGGTFPLWEDVFHFTYAENRGAAFGMLQGQMWLFYIITALACVLIIYCMIRFRKRLHPLIRICLSLIVAGALGNLIDRVFLGYVRDMLDFRLINFAIFNVADSAVVVGAILLVIDLLFLKKGKALADDIEKYFERKKKTAAEPARDSSAEEKTAESPAQKEEDPIDS